MKTFRTIQVAAAAVGLLTAVALADNSHATHNELIAGAVLAVASIVNAVGYYLNGHKA